MTSRPPVMSVNSVVQVADYAPGATYGPRTLVNYELLWILHGSAQWRTEVYDDAGVHRATVEETLRPGTVALARRGNRDSYIWDCDRRTRHAYVHFQIEDFGVLGEPSNWPSVRAMSDPGLLDELCTYLLDLADVPSSSVRGHSDRLVATMLEVFVSAPADPARAELPDGVQRLVDHVAAAWAESGPRIIPVPELATAASLSAGHLHRIFRERYGCGPAYALDLVRLVCAASALLRTNATIAEVASDCGYSNPYHFSRRFSQAYGEPPGTFRRRRQLSDPLAPVRAAGLLPVARRLLAAQSETAVHSLTTLA
ncbi:helix-turn-helix domain-containing protein [Kribbella sp. NPDC051952]|uniref:helix-turn-helix domain-containing protein n=1 Tax=Kribbella sp. NPDC051952 TaxID=3154851 RepID=UPI00344696DE